MSQLAVQTHPSLAHQPIMRRRGRQSPKNLQQELIIQTAEGIRHLNRSSTRFPGIYFVPQSLTTHCTLPSNPKPTKAFTAASPSSSTSFNSTTSALESKLFPRLPVFSNRSSLWVQVFFTLFFFLAALESVPAFLELWLGWAAGGGCEKSSKDKLRHFRSGNSGKERAREEDDLTWRGLARLIHVLIEIHFC